MTKENKNKELIELELVVDPERNFNNSFWDRFHKDSHGKNSDIKKNREYVKEFEEFFDKLEENRNFGLEIGKYIKNKGFIYIVGGPSNGSNYIKGDNQNSIKLSIVNEIEEYCLKDTIRDIFNTMRPTNFLGFPYDRSAKKYQEKLENFLGKELYEKARDPKVKRKICEFKARGESTGQYQKQLENVFEGLEQLCRNYGFNVKVI